MRRVARTAAASALALLAVLPLPVAGAATKQLCVEVVVDYGDLAPGRAPSASCIKVDPGASGADVLEARAHQLGVAKPRYRSDGLLCAIDGRPAPPDCARSTPGGGYQYWSYWRRHGTSPWSYSNAGPFDTTVGGTHPAEGWAWVDGGKEATRKPADVPYTQVCPTTSPTPSPTAAHHAARQRNHRTHPGPATATATAQPTQRASTRHKRHHHHVHTTARTPMSTTTTTTNPRPTRSVVPTADPPSTKHSSTPLVGAIAGGGVVAAIAGGAFWRARQR
jgi:hypothetical protein